MLGKLQATLSNMMMELREITFIFNKLFLNFNEKTKRNIGRITCVACTFKVTQQAA